MLLREQRICEMNFDREMTAFLQNGSAPQSLVELEMNLKFEFY